MKIEKKVVKIISQVKEQKTFKKTSPVFTFLMGLKYPDLQKFAYENNFFFRIIEGKNNFVVAVTIFSDFYFNKIKGNLANELNEITKKIAL